MDIVDVRRVEVFQRSLLRVPPTSILGMVSIPVEDRIDERSSEAL